VLTVADASGKQVRQLDAVSKSGLHRTPWDLREAPPAAPQGQTQRTTPPADPDNPDAEAQPPAAGRGGGGRGGRGGAGGGAGGGGGFGGRGFARSGPLVKPGLYTVTLGRSVSGTVTPVGQPQTVEVTPLQ
jgi:hypothetical protein